MPIYTKNGDAGKTDLYNGKRVLKCVEVVEVLGELDELNAFLGLTRLLLKATDSKKISQIQNDLFLLGSFVAGVKSKQTDREYVKLQIKRMEQEIDLLENRLAPIRNFILPNGCASSARLHLARAICRRCERSLVALGKNIDLVPYLNRLSDYLFVLARSENLRHKVKDELVITSRRQ